MYERRFIGDGPDVPGLRSPISQAVVIKDPCYVSGQLAVSSNAEFVPVNLHDETQRAFANVFAIPGELHAESRDNNTGVAPDSAGDREAAVSRDPMWSKYWAEPDTRAAQDDRVRQPDDLLRSCKHLIIDNGSAG